MGSVITPVLRCASSADANHFALRGAQHRTAAARRATTPRCLARWYASDAMNAWTSTPTGRIPFQQLAAKHDAGAMGQFCDQVTIPSAATGFMTCKMIQWKTDDCATALFNDEVAPHPYPQV
jgi:hypothetical protein